MPRGEQQHLEDAQVLQVLRLRFARDAFQLVVGDPQPLYPSAVPQATELAAHRDLTPRVGTEEPDAERDEQRDEQERGDDGRKVRHSGVG